MSKSETNETGGDGTDKSKEFVKTYGKENDDYGYYFYPNRSPGKVKLDENTLLGSFKNRILYQRNETDTMRCRQFIKGCVSKYPKVKMVLRALEAHGCPVTLDRHIQCEPCRHKVTGGFDHTTNQVVICDNNVKRERICCDVLAHELLHAFDKCRSKLDMSNLEQVACTEIRAANLLHCSLMSALYNREASPLEWENRQQVCVKNKAIESVLLIRNIDEAKAEEIVEKVFNRCFNDLEPFGRRIRRNMRDDSQALRDGLLFGYTPSKAESEAYYRV